MPQGFSNFRLNPRGPSALGKRSSAPPRRGAFSLSLREPRGNLARAILGSSALALTPAFAFPEAFVMKLVFLAPVTVAASFRDTTGYSFAQYLEEFGKAYSGAEHTVRKALFEAQLAKVNKHNEEYKKALLFLR